MEDEVSLQRSKESATCPVLRQINPGHATSSYSKYSSVLSSHLYLGLRSGLLPSGFPIKILYGFTLSPIRVIRTKLPGIFTCLRKFTKETPGIAASHVYENKNKQN
jgi:hypothetical protein